MLQNYLKIAVRNLLRNKSYSFINIAGLSMGVACCLLLVLFILDEYSVDKHQANLENLYRITTEFKGETGIDKLASTSPPIAMALKDEIPEIENAVRVLNPPGVSQNLIKYEDKLFYETAAWWFLNNFLERYPYRIEISWWVIALAGAFALAVALIVVSTQALRVALSNPVNSLRNE